VNFAGYHAEAGLGGLLRGAGTGGGLHASAGTPWGAHAGAGLGGQLNGEDGSLGQYRKQTNFAFLRFPEKIALNS